MNLLRKRVEFEIDIDANVPMACQQVIDYARKHSEDEAVYLASGPNKIRVLPEMETTALSKIYSSEPPRLPGSRRL